MNFLKMLSSTQFIIDVFIFKTDVKGFMFVIREHIFAVL